MLSARELSILIKQYYEIPGNGAGGNCHIVLDDLNIDNDNIKFCIYLYTEQKDNLGLYIMDKMFEMRKTARRKAIALSINKEK